MLELKNNQLVFSFPEIHADAVLAITFQRTLRIPDDSNTYELPPGLGSFPVRQVDEFASRIPEAWKEHGGIMLPMYQSEAMWLNFSPRRVSGHGVAYPFAIKVATGRRSALTGKEWESGLREKDYAVSPKQKWLDGYVVSDGVVRQFVAAPLGAGFTAEEQITGKAEFGGLQIEVYPMTWEAFDRRFPKRPSTLGGGILRSAGFSAGSAAPAAAGRMKRRSVSAQSVKPDMGLAPGGKMKQQIFEDPYGLFDWDMARKDRCFVHLANSLAWKSITGQASPNPPLTSAEYTRYNYPWYSYYDDGSTLTSTPELGGLKSVVELGEEKGYHIIPENESVAPINVKNLSPDKVRDGKWA